MKTSISSILSGINRCPPSNATTRSNQDAAKVFANLVRLNKNVTIQLMTRKSDASDYIKIEAKGVDSFFMEASNEALQAVLTYIMTGGIVEYAGDEDIAPSSSDEDKQVVLLKHAIENNDRVSVTPRYRSYDGKIRATCTYIKGKILFALDPTDDITEYLQDHQLLF